MLPPFKDYMCGMLRTKGQFDSAPNQLYSAPLLASSCSHSRSLRPHKKISFGGSSSKLRWWSGVGIHAPFLLTPAAFSILLGAGRLACLLPTDDRAIGWFKSQN